jgi:tetratricopeptide (TPR) repeat protein
LPMLL